MIATNVRIMHACAYQRTNTPRTHTHTHTLPAPHAHAHATCAPSVEHCVLDKTWADVKADRGAFAVGWL